MKTRLIVCTAVLTTWATHAGAWHAPGHELASKVAVAALPDSVPAFLREGAAAVANYSSEPDLFTKPFCREASHVAAAPDHYLDWERVAKLDLQKLPPTRYEFLKAIYNAGFEPKDVGLLPYSVVEWTDRLAAALAEYRKWPKDKDIRAKCLLYAGMVAHYAQDLHMPLHTTVHYDGRLDKDGNSPRSGIHLKLDATLGKLKVDPKEVARAIKVEPLDPDKMLEGVMADFRSSHGKVERVYELADAIPTYKEKLEPDSQAARFARGQLDAAARLTARLILTAWERSEEIKLPEWHHRPAETPEE
ncbi:MAG: hypothetical protein ACLFV7_06715 [Phycisphaerae bacterium]